MRGLVIALAACGLVAAALAWVRTHPELVDKRHLAYEAVARQHLEKAVACVPPGAQRPALGPYNRVSDFLVVLEDRTFFSRRTSFDSRALVRALGRTALSLGRERQGASGLPQQVAGLSIAESRGGPIRHDLRYKATQYLLASRLFGDYSRGAFEVALLDRMPCGGFVPDADGEGGLAAGRATGVTGARACAALLFGEELGPGPDLDERAALIAAFVRAPSRYRRRPALLRQRALYALRVLARHEGRPAPESPAWPSLVFDHMAGADLSQESVCEAGRFSVKREITSALRVGLARARALVPEGTGLFATALLGDRRFSAGGAWNRRFEGGSLAKVWMLRAIASVPEHRRFLTDVTVPPRYPLFDLALSRWSPRSVGIVEGPVSLLSATARSHNRSYLSGALWLPYWSSPSVLQRLVDKHLTPAERDRFSTERDRRLALLAMERVTGYPYASLPADADPRLHYRLLLLVSLRQFLEALRRDVPGVTAPEAPSALIGGAVATQAHGWMQGLLKAWFEDEKSCRLTDVGDLLAQEMGRQGTLHGVLVALKMEAPGKTGTARLNAQAVIGLCARVSPQDQPVPLLLGLWAFSTTRARPVGILAGRLAPALVDTARDLARRGMDLVPPRGESLVLPPGLEHEESHHEEGQDEYTRR